MRTITYNGTSLNSEDIVTRKISHDEATPRDLYSYDLTRERGTKIVNSEYKFKKIMIEGIIKGTSADNLEGNIDSFKSLLTATEKNLDVQYASGTRRYSATATSVVIIRDFYHLQYAPFSVEFFVAEGTGKDTSATSYSTYSIELASLEDVAFNVRGTIAPPCTVELEFNLADTVSTVQVTINGDKITVDESISASDILIVDTENKKVTVNGAEVDYKGRFPRLVVGSNSYLIGVSSVSHQYDVEINYTHQYI